MSVEWRIRSIGRGQWGSFDKILDRIRFGVLYGPHSAQVLVLKCTCVLSRHINVDADVRYQYGHRCPLTVVTSTVGSLEMQYSLSTVAKYSSVHISLFRIPNAAPCRSVGGEKCKQLESNVMDGPSG
jgi:hypothetical protein